MNRVSTTGLFVPFFFQIGIIWLFVWVGAFLLYQKLRDRLKAAIHKIIIRQQLSLHSLISLLGGFGFDELEGHAIALSNGEVAFPVFFTLAQGWR